MTFNEFFQWHMEKRGYPNKDFNMVGALDKAGWMAVYETWLHLKTPPLTIDCHPYNKGEFFHKAYSQHKHNLGIGVPKPGKKPERIIN